jgi:uncharacterized protein (DUF58 family)
VRSVRPTGRGALVLAGAVIAYLAGWAFGTHELAALALALALAVPVAVVTVSRARRVEVRLVRQLPARTTEGHPVEASILVEPALRLVSAAIVERCAGLGDPTARLRHVPGGLVGHWTVDRPERGRYRLAPELVLEDALGLVRSRIPLDAAGLLRVEPQLVELGAQRSRPLALRDGTRHALRASVGDELAGVRDHEVGESLRRVHWRTTARRGRLTVREVEDHPREELLVLLDATSPGPGAAARSPAFECAVRAAGSLAVHAARSGIALSFESRGRHPVRVEVTPGASISGLLDALCSVESDGASPLAPLLTRSIGSRLCVVTSDLGPAVVERLRALQARRRPVAVVAIDAASWAGDGGVLDASAAVLARTGIEVVVVGRDDDLAERLAPLAAKGVAGAA